MIKTTPEMEAFFKAEKPLSAKEQSAFEAMQLQNEKFKIEMLHDVHDLVPSENIVFIDETIQSMTSD